MVSLCCCHEDPGKSQACPFASSMAVFPVCCLCYSPFSSPAARQVGSCAKRCGEERAAENADCVLMHLCNHHSGVRLQEDDKTAEWSMFNLFFPPLQYELQWVIVECVEKHKFSIWSRNVYLPCNFESLRFYGWIWKFCVTWHIGWNRLGYRQKKNLVGWGSKYSLNIRTGESRNVILVHKHFPGCCTAVFHIYN